MMNPGGPGGMGGPMGGPMGGQMGGPMGGPMGVPGGDVLMQIRQEDFTFFLVQNADLIETEDQTQIKKNLITALRDITISSILGITINIQIKNIPKLDFMKFNKFIRWTCRIPLFFFPFLLFQKGFEDKITDLAKVHNKYWMRLQRYQKTGDMRYMDPQGKLFQRFKETTGL